MGFFGTDDRIASLSRRVGDLSAQVEQLTATVELLARRQGLSASELAAITPPEPEWQAEARRLKVTAGPIPAIKLVRERTGMGLREAKEHIDRM